MKSKTFLKVVFIHLLELFSIIAIAQQGSPLGPLSKRTGLLIRDSVVVQLIQNSSGDRAHDYITQLSVWDRRPATEGYSAAAQWMMKKAKEYGLEGVIIEKYPSGGKAEYYGYVTRPQWKVNNGELWLTSPYLLKLTSFEELPMSLAFGSTTSNVETELIDIGAGTKDEDYAAGVKGKIVLTTSNPAEIYSRAVITEGALGVLSSWSVPSWDFQNRREGEFPNQVGWSSLPQKRDDEQSRFAFLISSRQAADILALMKENTVRIRAIVDAELSPGNLEVVSGIIPGSEYPDEEIIVSAHLCHYKPGANDNASGSAAILEMARTINYLIGKGVLPRPLRTIRFIWMPEYFGTYAWLSGHMNDPVSRIADLNFDMVGENQVKTGSRLVPSYTSDYNPSFINALMESITDFISTFNSERYTAQPDMYIGSILGTRDPIECHMGKYLTGSDHELYNNLRIGASSIGSWPDNFYHSSEDTPDKVDPTQLHRAVVIGLAAITTMAYCDDQIAPDLARQVLIYGRKRIADIEFYALKSIMASDRNNFALNDFSAGNQIAQVYRREKEAIGTVGQFTDSQSTKELIRNITKLLVEEEDYSRKCIEQAAAVKAAELNLSRTKKQLTDSEKMADQLYPGFVKGKELYDFDYVVRKLGSDASVGINDLKSSIAETIEKLRANGVSELALYNIQGTIASYADGTKSILEIRDEIAAEYTLLPVEFLVQYFTSFEKAGVMNIKKNKLLP